MYGPNYSGFAFHPKAVRMVGSVHFGDFSVLGRRIRGAEPTPATLPARRRHIVAPVQKNSLAGKFHVEHTPVRCLCPARQPGRNTLCDRTHPLPHRISDGSPDTYPQCAEQATAIGERCSGSSSAPHRASDCFPCTYPPAASRRVSGSHLTKKQKRRVSRETRRPFPAHHTTDQAVFFANPRYVSITRGFCASSAAGPSSANSPVSST